MEENSNNVEEVSSTVPETVAKETIEEVESKKEAKEEIASADVKSYQFKSRLGKYLVKNKVSPNVLDIIYWHRVPKSAGIFGGLMLLLISLYIYPFFQVLTNFFMAILAVAFLYRIGMAIVNAVQKTSPEHPFQKLLDRDLKVSSDKIESFSKCVADYLNKSIKCLQDLFLVKDAVQSVKFGIFLWLLSYIADWFSPLCLVTYSVLIAFTLPKLYEEKHKQIDDAVNSVSVAIAAVLDSIKKKLPPSILKFLNMSEEKKTN